MIISNNCWGIQLYQDLKKAYNTPFVGCYFYPDDYIALLQNFPEILLKETLRVSYFSKREGVTSHPVGHLGKTIEIHFQHYVDFDEVYSKYQRRLLRMKESLEKNKAQVLVKFDDRLGASARHFLLFSQLSDCYHKVSFSAKPYQYKFNIFIDSPNNSFEVPDGYSLYSLRHYHFDLARWINNGDVKSSFLSIFAPRVKHAKT